MACRRGYAGTEVEAEAQRRIRRLVEELDELGRGRSVRDRDDYEQLIAVTDECRTSLDAITNIVDRPDWWLTNSTRRYWESNLEALARGVRIRRIFIYDELTPELESILGKQPGRGRYRTRAIPEPSRLSGRRCGRPPSSAPCSVPCS